MKLSKLKARTMMRSVGGCTIPRQNSTSIGMRKAMKASGGSCGDVEGGASRPRLDRPSRISRASGGSARRAEGGPTISEDSKKEASEQRTQAFAKNLIGGMLSGYAGAHMVGRGLRGLKGAALPLAAGAGTMSSAGKSGREAERIEKGQADPGKEDRASGGKVGGLEGLKDMKKGALRKSLHVKEGEKIPEKKLEKAEHSSNPTLRKRAVLARTMRGWKHGG